MTITPLPTRSLPFAAGQTRLTAHWVRVIDATGRPQLEIRWANEPFVSLDAA